MIYADLSEGERVRLRHAFAAGFALASGIGWQWPEDVNARALMHAIVDDYLLHEELNERPWLRDETPGRLLSLAKEGKP